MVDQDFTKRMVVVLDENLKSWQLLNTVGHISAFLGNKMQEKFVTGDFFDTKDGISYPRNSQYPIIALIASQENLKEFINKVREGDLLWVAYIPEMIEYTSDKKLIEKVGQKNNNDIEYLGIGIFGDNEKVKNLTKGFELWHD